MSKKILGAWLAFAAINAALFGCYLRIRENHTRLEAFQTTLVNEKVGIDASWNDLLKSQRPIQDVEKRLAGIRNFLKETEQRYPSGAPPGVVRLYEDMVAEHNRILGVQKARTREHNEKISAHELRVAAYNRKVEEADVLKRKAWNPFWFP